MEFKLVNQSQRALVHSWLSLPHVTKWFYGQGLQNTLTHLDDFLKGASIAQYWIAYNRGHPFAFLITSRVEKPHDELSKWCSEEGEAITLDMLIGDENYLGKGLAVKVIQEFLQNQFPYVDEVLIDPESTNERAIHVYQKAGFNILGTFIPSHSPHPHLMMRLEMKTRP
ncbi:MAG: GNAT family N-acetyltransferase [Verrucomicrobia bacterium]|nr:GNAT family N-acetyltransferase [Verrucomicrobiota bacterium]